MSAQNQTQFECQCQEDEEEVCANVSCFFLSSARFRPCIVDNALLNSGLVGTESTCCTFMWDLPIATVELDFCLAGFVTVVLFCNLVHLEDLLFSATDFDHCLSEGPVADAPVVDAFVFPFAASPCKLIRRKVFFASL